MHYAAIWFLSPHIRHSFAPILCDLRIWGMSLRWDIILSLQFFSHIRISIFFEAEKFWGSEMAILSGLEVNTPLSQCVGPSSYAAAASSPVMDLDPTPAQAALPHGDRDVFTSRPERIATSDPENFSGSKNIDIRMWLKILQRYFQDKNLPYIAMGWVKLAELEWTLKDLHGWLGERSVGLGLAARSKMGNGHLH